MNELTTTNDVHKHTHSLLNRVDEIRSVNYIPNNDDILQSRRKTSDIQKLEFQVKLPVKSRPSIQQTFCMFDVGGQRGERRKWIQVFDGVSAVMFLIDSSSFDAVDDENGRNKLRETINLFYEVWTTRFLLNSNFVLLFNKQDILREKIKRGHRIEDHFPEYKQYKCQPQDRALLSRAGEKLNLFRSSSRSSGSVAAARSKSDSSSFTRIGADLSGDEATSSVASAPPVIGGGSGSGSGNTSTTGSLREKRKSSLYRFRVTKRSADTSTTAGAAPTLNDATGRENNSSHNNRATSPSCGPAEQPAMDEAAASGLAGSPKAPGAHKSQQVSAEQQLQSTEQAYLRARSFIRDKFLQVTRQCDQDNLKRKYSSPNLMSYNSKGCVDQPKRTLCYHYTTATDTENIRDLFENLQKMVIKSTLKDMRLV